MKHWQPMTQDEFKKYVPDPYGEIERLQEQLEEANNVIKLYYKPIVVTSQITDDYIVTEEIPTDSSVAFNYLEKWGVK